MTNDQNFEHPPKVQPGYLRLEAAAEYCSLSPQMITKLTGKGQGPPRIMKGRAVLYSVKALDDWMLRDEEKAA